MRNTENKPLGIPKRKPASLSKGFEITSCSEHRQISSEIAIKANNEGTIIFIQRSVACNDAFAASSEKTVSKTAAAAAESASSCFFFIFLHLLCRMYMRLCPIIYLLQNTSRGEAILFGKGKSRKDKNAYIVIDPEKGVLIEGCRQISECTEVQTCIKTKRYIVEVYGSGLRANTFNIDTVEIEGDISSVVLTKSRRGGTK